MSTGKVLNGKLLVKQDDAMEKTQAGIYIPDTNKEKPKKGVVIVAGEPLSGDKQIQEGDRVFFADHAGREIALDEDDLSIQGEYVLLDQAQVLFIKTKK